MANLDAILDPTIIKVSRLPYLTQATTLVSDDTSLLAADTIPSTYRTTRIQGSGGAVTMTSTPTIAVGTYDTQRLTLHGINDTNTVLIQDESSLTSSGLRLSGGKNYTLGLNDTMDLQWYESLAVWVELHRSDSY